MKNLRTVRIFLGILLFVLAAGYAFFTPPLHQPLISLFPYTQIVPSMLAMSIGAIIFWIAMTWIFGRVYCASFCPIGALQDGVRYLRRKITGREHGSRGGRYRRHRNLRYQLLLVYVVSLITGFVAVAYVLEPWQIFCNIASTVHPSAVEGSWIRLGTGAGIGVIAGVVSLLLIVVWSWVADRDFCNTVCPIGTILGLFEPLNVWHIEIDPDRCINCMKCEEICPAGCVKVVGRYVDNSRCVCCMDCTAICPNDAIRYQRHHNRAATPLMQKNNNR